MIAEPFWALFRDPGHWEFELFLMLIFDGLVGALAWPRVRAWLRHHRNEEVEHAEDDRRIAELLERVSALEQGKIAVTVDLSDEEHTLVERAAAQHGMSVSEFLADVLDKYLRELENSR